MVERSGSVLKIMEIDYYSVSPGGRTAPASPGVLDSSRNIVFNITSSGFASPLFRASYELVNNFA